MKIQTQRFIDRWVGQLLCGVVSGWVKFTGLFGAPARMCTQNILVILLSEMGSIVLAGPMFAPCAASTPGGHPHPATQEEPGSLQAAEPDRGRAHAHAGRQSGGSLVRDILAVSLKMRRLGLTR